MVGCLGQLSENDLCGLMDALRIGGMEDSTAVELLSCWARRGSSDGESMSSPLDSPSVRKTLLLEVPNRQKSKRQRIHSPRDLITTGQPNPVDHIFQFHRALRRDFRQFESQTNEFVKALELNTVTNWESDVQDLTGRFAFIWGLYQVGQGAMGRCVDCGW